MKNEITIYRDLYKVIFKWDEPTKLITPQQYTIIKQKLFKSEWIELDDQLYNPFEVIKIIKYKTQDWIVQRLWKECEEVQIKVKEEMRVYKKPLTLAVLENMIAKHK